MAIVNYYLENGKRVKARTNASYAPTLIKERVGQMYNEYDQNTGLIEWSSRIIKATIQL